MWTDLVWFIHLLEVRICFYRRTSIQGTPHGTKERFLCSLPLHDVQLHLPELFHFAFYSVMENLYHHLR